MDCCYCTDSIIRELKKALKKSDEDLRKDVEQIVKKHRKKCGSQVHGDYYVRAGKSYLVDERGNNLSEKVFKQILARNYRGLYLSRDAPEDILNEENVKFYWISTARAPNAVAPTDLPKMLSIVKEFLKEGGRCVVMIESSESLILHNGFDKFLKFVQSIKDAVSESRGILLVSMNMKARTDRERALIEEELVDLLKKK